MQLWSGEGALPFDTLTLTLTLALAFAASAEGRFRDPIDRQNKDCVKQIF